MSPAASVIVAVRVPVSPDPPAEQSRPVSAQPATALSVTVKLPGSSPLNVVVFGSVASASSSSLNGDRPAPVVVNAEIPRLLGTASFTIVIEPELGVRVRAGHVVAGGEV